MTAVFAADALARLSRSIGVVCMQEGPCLTSTVAAVINAKQMETPLLIMSTAIVKGRGHIQDIDHRKIFNSVCKCCLAVSKVRDIVPTIRKAFQLSQSGVTGPVFIDFDFHTLLSYSEVDKELRTKQDVCGAKQRIKQWYNKIHLADVFHDAFEEREMFPLSIDRPPPSASTVGGCVNIVSGARRPLLLIGSQAILPPVSLEDLRKAVEGLGIPCFLSGMARGLLGVRSKIEIRHKLNDAVKSSDVVILAGQTCHYELDYGRIFDTESQIITINRNPDHLYSNSYACWSPAIAVECDVGMFLIDLSKRLGHCEHDKNWINRLHNGDNETEDLLKVEAMKKMDSHLNPIKLLLDINDVLSDNSIIVADGGELVTSAECILRATGPLQWLDMGAFNTMGIGAGFAIGAKIYRPESDVWIICGDGSVLYSMVEFNTFQRYKLPVIVVVGNNWEAPRTETQQGSLSHCHGNCNTAKIDYEKAAEAFGAKGIDVDIKYDESIKEILRKAVKDTSCGHSVLINCVTSNEHFCTDT